MKESLYNASEELKRAEHLLYVSLKYTRTSDVVKSLVDRLISSFDYIIDGILEQKEEEGVLHDVPKTPFAKIEVVKKLFKDEHKMLNYIEFYSLLRRIARSASKSKGEFRRNLTVVVNIDGKNIELTIDIMTDYFKRTLEFLRYVKDNFDIK